VRDIWKHCSICLLISTRSTMPESSLTCRIWLLIWLCSRNAIGSISMVTCMKQFCLANTPPPRGKDVDLQMFIDSNHASDHLMQWLCTGFLIYLNMAPIIVSACNHLTHLGSDKICMMTTRLACNRAIESSYWRMDNNSDVGLLTGYVLYQLPIELESMDLDTFSRWIRMHPSLRTSW
jgi:hypothetical protein